MGLDISTTTIGIAVTDGYNLLYLDHYKPDHSITELKRLLKAREHVLNIADQFGVEEFAVEEYIQYMKGGSGAKTIIPLALMNRTICLGIYERYNRYPNIISVLSVRHALKKTKELPQKEEMPELVASILGIDFPWEYSKKSKLIVENYDRADALAVALAFWKKKYGNSGSISVIKSATRRKSRRNNESISETSGEDTSGRKQGRGRRRKVQEGK
jgi:Holliday junction resolvasome RuvABC endonuclease subunit